MAHQIIGRITRISAPETRGTFSFRRFVVETAETGKDGKTYPNCLEFQAVGRAIEALGAFVVGDEIDVAYDIRGRMTPSQNGGEARCWINLTAFGARAPAGGSMAARPRTAAPVQPPAPESDRFDVDAIPF